LVPKSIEREIVIDAPVDVVWAVVTRPEHIAGWFSDRVEVDLTPGGKLLLHWDGHGSVPGRVERVDEPHLFSFRWSLLHSEDAAEENWTLVEFSLEPEGDSTRLKVVESGFRDVALTDAERQQHHDDHRGGWEVELGHLVDYVGRQ
jgi:uncharacterized protein YndB with AHSA1/START domain